MASPACVTGERGFDLPLTLTFVDDVVGSFPLLSLLLRESSEEISHGATP
jgi:hypothetical protein